MGIFGSALRFYCQDADSDTRVVRRIARDTVERGRTLDSIMEQYESTVKPMHKLFVEPSKPGADVIVNNDTGHDLDRAVKLLSNHLRLESGILVNELKEVRSR